MAPGSDRIAQGGIETERLLVRPPQETDRKRFIELFVDDAFNVFGPAMDEQAAVARFERMLDLARSVPYAKQPLIEKATGTIVGYTGVGLVDFEGQTRLEWGWRLTPSARGLGYATEAAAALLGLADTISNGEMLCIIDVENAPSRRVADKLGFRWWKHHIWPDDPTTTTDLLIRPIGSGGPPLVAPERS